jgi:peptidoglycan/xylan/chitin deacetylase (PgdA/CDA1 family)
MRAGKTSHTTRWFAMAHDAAVEWPPQASNEEQTVRRRSSRNSYACLAKEIVARCLLWSGVIYAVRRLLWRDRVLIVVYHDPEPEALDSHLAYLCRIAAPVRLSDLPDRRRSSTGRPRFVVTVDDGHAGNARLLGVFRAHGVRPTIFLCSAIVGTHRQYWWQHSEAVTGRFEQLTRMPNVERLAVLSTMGFAQDAEIDAPAALSKRDIEHIKGSVDFQSHGRFHPVLPCCDDDDCRIELGQSMLEIEKLVGRECRSFAFPNGSYGEREIRLVKSAGYESARTLDAGWNDGKTDPFRLKAVSVSDDASWTWFAVQISFIPAYLRYLRRGSFFGRAPRLQPNGWQNLRTSGTG